MRRWSDAFIEQAASDLEVFERLSRSGLPQCHYLHYLQMWLEKLCKAYVHKADLGTLKGTHNLVAKVLPRLIHEHWRRIGLARQPEMNEVRALCREIDLLHPQVDDGRRKPENVEYPWLGSSGEIEVPAQWKFPIIRRLYSNSGRLLLKASDVLTRNPAILQK